MDIFDILLIAVALSMDAIAAGLTDGMREPKMGWEKTGFIALTFGAMQCGMPLLGYLLGGIFTSVVEKIAPWLSFALLAFIGGKSVVEYFSERKEKKRVAPRRVREGEILVQGVATSLDALAVGITFLAAETANGLPMSVIWCAVIIGVTTFVLSLAAVLFGKKIGSAAGDKAKLLGGAVLIAIGVKILLEGLTSAL